jgi:hypothetical protein
MFSSRALQFAAMLLLAILVGLATRACRIRNPSQMSDPPHQVDLNLKQ